MIDFGIEMSQYRVGFSYPQFKGIGDGYLLEYRDGTLWLYVLMNGWTAAEKRFVSASEPVKFRFVEKNGVGFLCTKFGGMPWGDSPIHPALYKEAGFPLALPELKTAREGIALTVVCVETATGTLLNLRVIGLGNKFSKELINWISAKWDEPMSRTEYNNRINQVYAAYSSDGLAEAAPLRWNLKV